MPRDLIEEANRWDLVPEPASLWWTSTYDPEERWTYRFTPQTGYHKFPFEEKFRILGYALKSAIEIPQRQDVPVEDHALTTGPRLYSFLFRE